MFKLVITMKKKAGMSREDFIDYYNNKHLAFVAKALPPLRKARRTHRRNFVVLDDPFLCVVTEGRAVTANPDFDAMTEVIFESREAAMEMFAAFFHPDRIETMKSDERNFVEMDSIKFYVAEVFEATRG